MRGFFYFKEVVQLAYGVQPYDPSKPVVPKPPSNPMVNSYGAPLQPPSQSVPAPQNYTPSPPTQSYGVPQANTSVPKPAGYQGGGDYGQLDYAGKLQMQQDRARVESDPAFKQSEIQRTLGVIQGLGSADTTDQQNYLKYLQGVPKEDATPVPTPGGFNPDTSGTPQVPTYTPNIPTMDLDAIRKYAQETVQRKLSDLRMYSDQQSRSGQTAADQQIGALTGQYNKLKTTIGEDRSLEDVRNQRLLSPFSGKSDYAQGMIAQNRGRSDREMNDTFMSNQSNVQQNLSNLKSTIEEKYAALQNAAPNEAEQIFQSIKNDERNYDMMVHGQLRDDLVTNSQLNNTSFNQALQTFQANQGAQNQQFSQNMQNKQANWGAYGDMVNWTGNISDGPMQDWGNLGKIEGAQTIQGKNAYLQQQSAQLSNDLAKLQLADYPQEQRLKIQEMQKRIAEIGKTPYQSPNDLEMARVKLETAKAELNSLTNPQSKRQTAEDYATGTLNKIIQRDSNGNVTNPQQLESSILLAPISEYEQYKLYNMYGLKWNGPIPSPN
jgi:hypothetical protein